MMSISGVWATRLILDLFRQPELTADTTQIGDLVQQCVDQGAGLHARSG
jgi:hypothetical protein